MIGQIIYNLEDYAGTGGLISTDKSSISTTVSSAWLPNAEGSLSPNESYEERRIDIFSTNVLSNYGVNPVYKLGIQAPPGTKFYLNATPVEQEDASIIYTGGQEIIIGRTGIYELDDDIKVDSLIFTRPKRYTIDIDLTNQYISEGITQMENAKREFDIAYRALRLKKEAATSTMTNDDFWEEYDDIHSTYVSEYNAARAKYIQGLSGVYVKNDYLEDLKNVIIDFMYNSIGEEST